MAELNHELRAKGVGSSEIGMLIFGEDGSPLSPWGGPHRLAQKKLGVAIEEDPEKKPWLEEGKILESAILKLFLHKRGGKVRYAPGTRQHSKLPLAVDSVDALWWSDDNDSKKPTAALEGKNVRWYNKDEFGEEDTDEVPQTYLVQGQWHCGVWSLPRCYFPVFWGDGVKIYHTDFDEDLFMAMYSTAEKFWKDYIEPGKMPPVDGHKTTSEWLAKRLAKKNDDIVDADPETVKLMLEYRELRLASESNKDRIELLANQLKERIGEHKGVCIPDHPKLKITFNTRKGKPYVDYRALVAELAPDADFDELKKAHTKRGDDSRTFLPTTLLKNEIPEGVAS